MLKRADGRRLHGAHKPLDIIGVMRRRIAIIDRGRLIDKKVLHLFGELVLLQHKRAARAAQEMLVCFAIPRRK